MIALLAALAVAAVLSILLASSRTRASALRLSLHERVESESRHTRSAGTGAASSQRAQGTRALVRMRCTATRAAPSCRRTRASNGPGSRSVFGRHRSAYGTMSSPPTRPASPGPGSRRATCLAFAPVRIP